MPKENSLTALFSLLTIPIEDTHSPDHFLFLLGTDTVFTRRPTAPERSYERGETLSYSAQALVSLLGEEAEPTRVSPALSYSSPSVDVLDGPNTLGTNLGERIAQGLFLALRAAATGKKALQFAAHSRGAVQTILILHELERIKIALTTTPEKSLRDILLASPCSYTKAALLKLFPAAVNEDTLENRSLLCQRLNELQLNPFLIDPVPGDTVLGVPFIGWHDERFYKEPPCQHYELLLYRDERSACFYPIVPRGMKPTVIPGHHGTASGNRYTQQLGLLPEGLRGLDTTTVQDLVLLKLFNFIEQRTTLKQPTNLLDIGHAALDSQLNAYLLADPAAKQQLLLNQYNAVSHNDAAYRHFTKTCYQKLHIQEIKGHRYVHYQGPHYVSMDTITPAMHGSIVNTEHAERTLSTYFSFPIDREPSEQVILIRGNISAIMQGQDDLLLRIISTSEGKALFKNSLSMLVESIGQKYLRNHLATEEKLTLLKVIKDLFDVLPEERSPEDSWVDLDPDLDLDGVTPFLLECKSDLRNGITSIIETHQAFIFEQSSALHDNIISFLDVNKIPEPQENITNYLLNIEECYNKSNELINGYPLLNDLISPLVLAASDELSFANSTLIDLAGLMLKEKSYRLRIKPDGISEAFYALVKARAIEWGALSPEQEQAEQEKEDSASRCLNQLRELTKTYQATLLAEAKLHYPNVEVVNDNNGQLPELLHINTESTYHKIKIKFNIISDLYQALNDESTMPSQRLLAFETSLTSHNEALKNDHNPAWKNYVKSCLLLLAIIVTGIIPGVAYLKYTGKALFFNQNLGKKYIDGVTVLKNDPTAQNQGMIL